MYLVQDEQPDRRGGAYAVIPPRLIFDPNVSHPAKTVYAALACYADEDRECFPREAPIAHRLELSRSRISQCVAELVAAGYVQVERYQAEGQPRPTNHYRLVMDQPPKQANVSPANVTKVSPANVSQANLMNNIRSREHYKDLELEPPISEAPASRESGSTQNDAEPPPSPYARMRLHVLWQAFASMLGEPETIIEEGKWAKAIRALDLAGASIEEVRVRVLRFKQKWPRAAVTPMGMASNWSLLSKGNSDGYDPTYQRIVAARRADEAAERERRDLDHQRWLASLVGEPLAHAH